MEEALILPQGFRKEMQNYRNLNYSLTKSSFYIMVFNEKNVQKLLMLIPLLRLAKTFSITDNIVSTVKLFAGDTSIFSAVNDASISADKLNDLQKISEWVCKWKMSFNPDLRSDFFQKTKRIKLPQNLF